jgi:hypothetical protein
MYTPSRLHKKISIYTIMDPTTETNATEVVPVAVPETVVEPAESQEPVAEAAPEPVTEAAPEPVAEPVPEPAAEAAPEPVDEPEPIVETQDSDPENILDMSDYTTPEYLELVKKLIEKPEEETKEISKKTFKIPGYNSIQLINTSKQPRRKSMTFV